MPHAAYFSRTDAALAALALASAGTCTFAATVVCALGARAEVESSPSLTFAALALCATSALGALLGASIGAGALIAQARRACLAASASVIGILPLAALLWFSAHALD
ncbi:MAG: hypothetical protein IT454_22300 [Planctomycetes bacterium]|nr:hypothetical protein [Planctomycetota bacterium]